ncbi:DUF1629 domain-containing protein [Pseudomonas alliivorans]|nr:DUF1629 domain-containing protein [Pseudomonas alliivorans]
MKDFYLIKYEPDGDGAPYFFDLNWVPELPGFHSPSENPERSSLSSHYRAIADITELEADWLPDHFLASKKFMAVCDKFACSYISRPLDLILKGKSSTKDYFFFAVMERLRAMDLERSKFVLDSNSKTESDGADNPVFELIEKLVVMDDVESHLFYFEGIHETVCSAEFAKECVASEIFGLIFKKIDESYRYAPWEDF